MAAAATASAAAPPHHALKPPSAPVAVPQPKPRYPFPIDQLKASDVEAIRVGRGGEDNRKIDLRSLELPESLPEEQRKKLVELLEHEDAAHWYHLDRFALLHHLFHLGVKLLEHRQARGRRREARTRRRHWRRDKHRRRSRQQPRGGAARAGGAAHRRQ